MVPSVSLVLKLPAGPKRTIGGPSRYLLHTRQALTRTGNRYIRHNCSALHTPRSPTGSQHYLRQAFHAAKGMQAVLLIQDCIDGVSQAMLLEMRHGHDLKEVCSCAAGI